MATFIPLSIASSSSTVPSSSPISPKRSMLRRKSSAQNLLTTVAGGVSNPGLQMPQPTTGLPPSSGRPSPMGMPLPTPTPTTTTFGQKADWDSQSLHSDAAQASLVVPGMAPSPILGAASPAIGLNASAESLRELVQKRIVTLTYLRNVHQGRSHWFHTILIPRPELDRVFNDTSMRKRTLRFTVLGMSVSNLFDMTVPTDYLRALNTLLTEYEQFKEDTYKPKRRLFRSTKTPKRQTAGVNEYDVMNYDPAETSYLILPSTPFPMSYNEVLLSLIDILSEAYAKAARMLGSSPLNALPLSSSSYSSYPVGLSSAQPGVTYAWSGPDGTPLGEHETRLWEIANGAPAVQPGSMMPGGTGIPVSVGLGQTPPIWTPVMADYLLKIDGKLKKIIQRLSKELDTLARNSIKNELASLDPLLRNVALDVTNEQFDFEGAV